MKAKTKDPCQRWNTDKGRDAETVVKGSAFSILQHVPLICQTERMPGGEINGTY